MRKKVCDEGFSGNGGGWLLDKKAHPFDLALVAQCQCKLLREQSLMQHNCLYR